jgi:hypothetical protein
MKYNGIELTPITTPQVFNPPKEMLVWDVEYKEPVIEPVCAITGSHHYQVVTCSTCYDYCAKIPDEPKLKRVTQLQLMEWLVNGNCYKDIVEKILHQVRSINDSLTEENNIGATNILQEEITEAMLAFAEGDLSHCLQELAQCGAVILRTMEFVKNKMEKGNERKRSKTTHYTK